MAIHLRAKQAIPSVIDYIYNEIPSGNVNSSNMVFVLANTPTSNTVRVALNGMVQTPVIDYTISGKNINFVKAPRTGSEILVHYIR